MDCAKVIATCHEDVGAAANYLRTQVEALCGDVRVGAASNIAFRSPMVDHEGHLLATRYFGWSNRKSDRWWKLDHLALNSPLPHACRYEAQPFWCNGESFHPLVPNPFLDGISLVDFEKRAFASAAIVIPVHMPFGLIGAGSIVPRDPEVRDLSELFATTYEEVGPLFRAFICSYSRIEKSCRHTPRGVNLSPREVQVLRWAAGGKTDSEIGTIIHRSRATIKFHIRNASSKLEAVNRSQAVFKATQLGYI